MQISSTKNKVDTKAAKMVEKIPAASRKVIHPNDSTPPKKDRADTPNPAWGQGQVKPLQQLMDSPDPDSVEGGFTQRGWVPSGEPDITTHCVRPFC